MKKHILLVDDQECLALLGADLLQDFGFLVTAVFNGPEAYKIFSEQPDRFDLIITDETMPDMAGIELAQAVYELSPGTPVILCSGHLLTMKEAGMERTNIIKVLGKTDICLKLPDYLDELFQ